MNPWSAPGKSAGQGQAPQTVADESDMPRPWRPIVVDVPGPEFEARPPGLAASHPPDTECDGWSTADLTLRFASVRGANHRYYRRPRQDSARAAVHEPTGTIVFAVADGLSSAGHSERGAVEVCEVAVHAMLDLLADAAGPVDFQKVAYSCADRLYELAQWQLDVSDPTAAEVANLYGTTLVAGTVRPDPEGPVVDVFRIGDSGAWILDHADISYHPLYRSKTGADIDVVSNEVTPLPHVHDPLDQLATARLSPTQMLLVGTDGFGDPLGDGDGLVGALFGRHLLTPPSATWLAHVLDFSRETFDDDRTLLAVWPRARSQR
ncbi:protein phosphatase 2C domain-containing protein [Nocardia vinacea]|uniref:protein phosphatase 2C domain-containing protein n=1 Tax=Nocardia vinacea TaxID=96468 RepID=UPI002E1357F0|nr:protein phosphatase 2C domain-containing protein [Nocardia vinacea]